MNSKHKEAFEYWWKSHRGDVVGDEGHYASVTATEAQLYNWESEAFEAGANYRQDEIDKLREGLDHYVEEASVYARASKVHFEECNRLKEYNKKLLEVLSFTTKAAVHLFKPDKPLERGLAPFFYHTLSYEGDLELIENTKIALEYLKILESENELD